MNAIKISFFFIYNVYNNKKRNKQFTHQQSLVVLVQFHKNSVRLFHKIVFFLATENAPFYKNVNIYY